MNHLQSASSPSSSSPSTVRRPWLALVAAACLVLASALVPDLAEAKRLGGGKSAGMNRNMPERTAPNAAPAAAAPGVAAAAPNAAAAQAAKPAAAAPAAAAAQPKRSWLGPLAGLAAGFGLAALFSHLGLGAEFGSLILMALLAVAGFMVFKMLRNRAAGGGATPAMAGAGAGGGTGSSGMPTPWSANPAPLQRESVEAPVLPAPTSAGPAAYAAPVAAAFVPATFDSEGFERTAKAIFIRMQTANDTGNLNDLSQFTTPELFAQIKLELMDRGSAAQSTDVQKLDAKVLDVVEENGQSVVSVRYSGTVVEAAGQAPVAIDEVWHLVKAHGSERWLIAGIEQMG